MQLEWLTKAVAEYLQLHVVEKWPEEVSELCMRFLSLGLHMAAVDRVLELLQPRTMVELTRTVPGERRVEVFSLIAKKAAPEQCLEFLDLLLSTTDTELTPQEINAVISHRPELATALVVCPFSTDQSL